MNEYFMLYPEISNTSKDNDVGFLIIDDTLSKKDISTKISYYERRWNIEVSYRYHKSSLGLDEFQVESSKSINRYWSMVFLTYTFPEIFRVKNSNILKLKTLGDTISYFRNNYLVQIVGFAHSCADNGISLDSVISKLGLVA